MCSSDLAGEGGPYGMALLAAYMRQKGEGESLESYLASRVFKGASGSTIQPEPAAVEGFNKYMRQYRALLQVEQSAVNTL